MISWWHVANLVGHLLNGLSLCIQQLCQVNRKGCFYALQEIYVRWVLLVICLWSYICIVRCVCVSYISLSVTVHLVCKWLLSQQSINRYSVISLSMAWVQLVSCDLCNQLHLVKGFWCLVISIWYVKIEPSTIIVMEGKRERSLDIWLVAPQSIT